MNHERYSDLNIGRLHKCLYCKLLQKESEVTIKIVDLISVDGWLKMKVGLYCKLCGRLVKRMASSLNMAGVE